MTFQVSEHTIQQLEFTDLLATVHSCSQSPAARRLLETPDFPSSQADLLLSMNRIFQAHAFIRSVHPIRHADWCDLIGIEPTWVIRDKVIAAEDLRLIQQLLLVHEDLAGKLRSVSTEYPDLAGLVAWPDPLKDLLKRFERVFEPDGSISDRASGLLGSVRSEIRVIENRIASRAGALLREFSENHYLSGQQLTIRNGRLVLPVLAEHKRRIRGFIHDISGSGQTVFLEPQELVELNNDILELRSEEKKEIHRILSELSHHVRNFREEITAIDAGLIQLDVTQAWASALEPLNLVIPQIADEPRWVLQQAIHPVLFLNKRGKREGVVPLNLTLGESGDQFIVISGPNAGGKTVAMKCLGLLQLLVHAGIPVPAAEGTVFPLCESVVCVLGDAQSIQDDLSSFSGHVGAIRKVLDVPAGTRQLVLIDEITSGTDPIEGQALAIELVEEMLSDGFYGIITSHYPDLKLLPQTDHRVVNGSMLFNLSALQPTFEFRKGIPGSSYALELASRMGLSDRLVSRARNRLSLQSGDTSQLARQLESELEKLAEDRRHLMEQESRIRQIESDLERKKRETEQEAKEIRKRLTSEFRQLSDELRRTIWQQLDTLKQQKPSDLGKSRRELEQIIESAAESDVLSQPEVPASAFVVGQAVTIRGGSQSGEILSINSGIATVLAGTFRLKVPLKELVPVGKKASRPVSSQVQVPPLAGDVQFEINLIGLKVHEALDRLDYAIADSIAKQLPSLRIIHGKGTGALRKAVHDYLKNAPSVAHFELAQWYEGSTGATVVTFR